MNKIPEEGVEQLISIRTLTSEKEKEEEAIRAMGLLEGQEDNFLVVSEKTPASDFEMVVSTEDFEEGLEDSADSLDDHKEMEQVVSQIGSLNSLEAKRDFMRQMCARSLANFSDVALQEGATFDLDLKYNGLLMHTDYDQLVEEDEEYIQGMTTALYWNERDTELNYVQKGYEKIYRGNPDLWTPVDHSIPQDQHDKIRQAMRDYDRPVVYEEKFGTLRRRNAGLPKREQQKDYVDLPRRTNYED